MLSCSLKKLQLFTALPACGKIARTKVKVGKTRLLALVQLRAQEQAFNWLLIGWAMIRSYWGSIRWETGAVATKQASVTTLHVSVVWAFCTKIKLLIINRDSLMVFSVVVLLLKYNFYLPNTFRCLSSKNSLGWDFVYFATCFVGI